MGTTSSSSPSTNTYFSGSSPFAAQLQVTITQAVSIASLPLKQMQTQQSTLSGQQTELQNVTSLFSNMQAAVLALQGSTGVGAFSSEVSDPTIATASLSSGVMSGNYTLNVLSLGSQTNAVSGDSLTKVSDPSSTSISSDSSFTLSINGQDYQLSNPSGTLNGLAQAITGSSAHVQASVVNVGSSASPDYRLSLQSLDYAPDTIQLSDSQGQGLLNTIATGTNVTYQVNGQPSTPISSTVRSAKLSTGLDVQILKTGSTSINVSQGISSMATALSAFAGAYNTITDELNKNRGQNGGALTGDSVIYQLQTSLRNLTDFSTGDPSTGSLAALGLSFDENGHLNFDVNALSQAASNSASGVLDFIGTTTSHGFLQTAMDTISSITDASTGILTQSTKTVSNRLSDLNNQISDQQSQVTELQASLTARMATADATISSLQDQLTQITGLFAQMQANQRSNS